MEMNGSVGVKRPRDGEQDGTQNLDVESPEAKKLRGELLLEILDDDDDEVGSGEDRTLQGAENDLADVMKSFEEEIGATQRKLQATEQEESQQQHQQPELGFLLGASDDELGLPPTATTSEEQQLAGISGGSDGFGQIWGFEDEISSFYDNFGGAAGDFGGDQEGIVLGSGLFDDDFPLSLPSDLADLARRPETLPAV